MIKPFGIAQVNLEVADILQSWLLKAVKLANAASSITAELVPDSSLIAHGPMSTPLTRKAKVAAKGKVVAKVKAEGVVRDEARAAKAKEKENPRKAKAKARKAKAKAKAKAMEHSVPVVVRKSVPVDHPQGVSLHLE